MRTPSVNSMSLTSLGQFWDQNGRSAKLMALWGWVTRNLGRDYEPYAILQWSDDGGYTWSKERWESMGAKGKYKTRMHWHGLGHSRDRIFRVSISAPVKVVLINASIEARQDNDK